MLAALVPLLGALLGGTAPAAALAGLGVAGWTQIATSALGALPEELQLLESLHPIFAQIVQAVKESATSQVIALAAHAAAESNFEASLRLQPGMGDGTSEKDY